MTVRERGRFVALILLSLGALALGALVVMSGGDGALVVGGPISLSGVALAFVARQRVGVTQNSLILQYPIRRRQIPLSSIQGFRIGLRPNVFGERISRPIVTLTSGEEFVVPGLQQFDLFARHGEDFPMLSSVASAVAHRRNDQQRRG